MRLAVIGGGWAGLAAAVAAVRAGHAVTLYEAARTPGGRARTVARDAGDGAPLALDNGQHILIGAYSATLALMRQVGVDPAQALLRMPLALRFPDGGGLALPDWPAPIDLAAGIATARGWSVPDRLALLRVALGWRRDGFRCAPDATVGTLGTALTPRVRQELLEPLCVSALNTPADTASGAVFLRVLHDALFGPRGSSHLLLPRTDLGRLLPQPALRWLAAHGAALRVGDRVAALQRDAGSWSVDGQPCDAVLLATGCVDAARLVEAVPEAAAWRQRALALRHEAIATVYAQVPGAAGPVLPAPLLALRSGPGAPAQFAFDRGRLGGPAGLLALVVSASQGERADLEHAVLAQARAQLRLGLRPVHTIVEKRATFACTAGVVRPGMRIAPGLLACGDYVDGPYPATLEGAVRSGEAAVAALG